MPEHNRGFQPHEIAPPSDDFLDDRAIVSAVEDKLGHAPLAREIAELARGVETPVSIALFGPWGSGKSSLLRLIGEDLEASGTPVVYLDAWKYAETPLARQFISTTAEQLSGWGARKATRLRAGILPGPYYERFAAWRRKRVRRKVRSRLYEARRTRKITFRGGWSVVLGLVVFLATLTFGIGFAATITTVVADMPWGKALESVLPNVLGGTTIAALATFALASFTSDSDIARAASEEEFEEAFRDGVRSRVGESGRVVFLVDEIDRTRPSEILATFETLRIFLEVDGCVFIVAGDRQVIEDALNVAPLHGAPPFPQSTYQAMAGSFLDKMFQIQLDLPPLNEERLTEFVFRLLSNQSGIWAEPDLELDELVPILIPSHVRSPRRAKVLINAFASALRLARTRFQLNRDEATDPSGQELALAKLVVLRTEFPLFAEELPEHPTLTEAATLYFVAREDMDDETDAEAILEQYPERVVELVRDFAAGRRSVEQTLPVASDAQDDGASSAPSRAMLTKIRGEELSRYLTGTRDTPYPNRNLIFGTVLGGLYGLNAETAAALEAGSLDGRPREVERVLHDLEADQRVAAIKLVGNLSAKRGAQGRRAMESLFVALEVAEGDALEDASVQLSNAFENFIRKNSIPDRYAPLVLRISRWLSAPVRGALQLDLLDRDAWRQADQSIQETLASAPFWTDEAISKVSEALPTLLQGSPQTTLSALRRLPSELTARLWSMECWTVLAEAEFDEEDEIRAIAEQLGEVDRATAWNAFTTLVHDHSDMALKVVRGLGGATCQQERLDLIRAVAEQDVDPSQWNEIGELLNG